MLVCVKPLVTTYDGSEVRLLPGRSRVVERHPIALAHPECFKPVPGRPRGGRERVITSGASASMSPAPLPDEPRGLEMWRVRASAPRVVLANRPSRVRVRLSARAELVAALDRAPAGLEAGMLLRGASCAELVEAIDLGPLVIGDRDRLAFDFEQVPEDAIGDLHSHPGASGVPSARDLRAWSAARRGLGRDAWLGVVAVRTSRSWELVGWVVHAGLGAHDLAERAVIGP